MAKKIDTSVNKKEKPYPYPSRYGSHASMLDTSRTKELQFRPPDQVVCVDEEGSYVTDKRHLDSGLADPYRTGSKEFRERMLAGAFAKGIGLSIGNLKGLERIHIEP